MGLERLRSNVQATAGRPGPRLPDDLGLSVPEGDVAGQPGRTPLPSSRRRSAPSLRPPQPEQPFRPPQGILETRLKAFFSWAIEVTGTRTLFLTDDEGLVLMESGASSEMIAVTSSVANLLDRIRTALGSEPLGVVAIDLDPRRILHVVRVDSGLGVHTLGLVASQPLRRPLLEELRSAVSSLLAAENVEELFGT